MFEWPGQVDGDFATRCKPLIDSKIQKVRMAFGDKP